MCNVEGAVETMNQSPIRKGLSEWAKEKSIYQKSFENTACGPFICLLGGLFALFAKHNS